MRQPVGPPFPDQRLGFREGPHALLEEQRVALRPLDESALERVQARVGPEQARQQIVRALRRQRVDAELPVVGLAAPPVLVFGAVVGEQQQPGRRQALDEAVEQGLGLGVDPVQVLDEQHERLDLALPQQQPLHGVQRPLPALRGIEPPPRRILHRNLQEREQRRQGGLQGTVEGQHLAGHLLADRPRLVPPLDVEVRLEEIDDGEIGRGLAVGDGAGLQNQPAVGAMGVGELPVEAGLADAGLADHRDDLAVPGLRPLEGLAELIHLAVAADKAGQPPGGGGVQPGAHGPGADEFVDLHRRRAGPSPAGDRAA